MDIAYHTVDVFTDRAFGGNQLAVVPDARGLDAAQMQAIATEFNYAETTFVLPPADPRHTAHVRIFTPKAEMPFAGHPNVGTAFLCARLGEVFGTPVGDRVVFEEAVGLVPLDIAQRDGAPIGATFTAPKLPERGETLEAAEAAACLGLAADDVAVDRHRPILVSVGVAFLFVELKSATALARARGRIEAIERLLPVRRATGVLAYVRTAGALDLAARMFAPLVGVPEDPATGSAAAGLIGLLGEIDLPRDGEMERRIAQGVEMGRPSTIRTKVAKRDGHLVEVRVGGDCVSIMRGTLTI